MDYLVKLFLDVCYVIFQIFFFVFLALIVGFGIFCILSLFLVLPIFLLILAIKGSLIASIFFILYLIIEVIVFIIKEVKDDKVNRRSNK